MPRTKRLVSDDAVLHIVQRGNNKQTIFREDEDFEKFLSIIPDFAIAKSARRADRLNPTGFNLARRGNPKQISNANFGIKKLIRSGLWQAILASGLCPIPERRI